MLFCFNGIIQRGKEMVKKPNRIIIARFAIAIDII